MSAKQTLLLRRSDIENILTLEDCIDAVEEMFRQQGLGELPPAGVLGIKTDGGGLHVKAAHLPGEPGYIVAKLNTNFPENRARHDLPTIQGVILLCDANNGLPLALLDSIDITIKRTAAASAVAAKYLARRDSNVATICGCGQQSRAQLRALQLVRPLKKVYAFDVDLNAAKDFAADLASELDIEIEPVADVRRAIQQSHICITCTPSQEFFLRKEDAPAGIFIAAVGADDAHKQEIDPELMASAKVVVDSAAQCCAIGDTHHAIAQGLMTPENIYAELGEIVARRKPGRMSENEIIIFDSTGVAIEDAVAAVAVYEKARGPDVGSYFDFAA